MTPRPADLLAPSGAPRSPKRRADRWKLERGATVVPGGVRFAVWAPRARTVAVRVYGRDGRAITEQPLQPAGDGTFQAMVAGVTAGVDYRYVLDGAREVADPVSRWQPDDVFGPSRVVDPHAFAWNDRQWRGPEPAELVLYELHVGTFTHHGTFDAVIPHLRELRDLGATAIELMPVAEFPGTRNWGYDGVHLYAPESSYGGPDGLRRLVDAAHAEDLAVLLDVVYNHTGPEGSVLQEYGPYFIEKYKTPWGGGPNLDAEDSDEVRRYLIDNALYWVTEYHLDGLRLDASEFIHDFSARHVLEELATAVHEQGEALGRRILVTAETSLNDPRWVRPPEQGGFGMDATWLDDFHHAVRTAVTDERAGYYRDFDGVASLAKSYADRYVYDGQRSANQRRRRGQPAHDVPTDRFIACIQNHDQVGNRALGERLDALTSFAQRKVATAALLLSPFVPLLFMGEEYGEPNPFLYFVSHQGAELVEAVRQGRREEFRAFAWADEVPDPAAEDTFRRSKLDRGARERPEGRALLALYGALLRLRRELPFLRPGGAGPAVAHDADAGWIRLAWPDADAPHLAVLNFSAEARTVPLGEVAGGTWRRVLATDQADHGGDDASPAAFELAPSGRATLDVPPHTAALYRLESV